MRNALLALACLASAACVKEPPPEPAAPGAAGGTITIDALHGHVAWLADDDREGRMAGQPGYDAAAQYVADRFAEFGLEPAGEDGWFQPVPLITYRLDEQSTTLIAHHYHQPSDDMARTFHWASALRFARANVSIGAAIANADERPAWNEGDFFGERFGR